MLLVLTCVLCGTSCVVIMIGRAMTSVAMYRSAVNVVTVA